ncbi:MAG: nuclease A inhibitor family protein [Cyanobacteria bacterium P01_G01_bin.67]
MDNSSNSELERELIEQLELATKDLFWLSEAEYPVQVIYWQNANDFNLNMLLQRYNYPPGTKIVIQELASFFATATTAQEWHNQTEQTEVKKYRDLLALLRKNLLNIKVYLLGEIEIDACIVGRTKHNEIAGVTTKIIST